MDEIDGHRAVVLAQFVEVLVGGDVEGGYGAVDEEDEIDAFGDGVVEGVGEVDPVAVEARHVGDEDLAGVGALEQFAARGGDGGDDGVVALVVGGCDIGVDVIVVERVADLGQVLPDFRLVGDDAAEFVDDEVEILLLAVLVLGGIDLDATFRLAIHARDDGGPDGALQFVGGTDITVGEQVDKS